MNLGNLLRTAAATLTELNIPALQTFITEDFPPAVDILNLIDLKRVTVEYEVAGAQCTHTVDLSTLRLSEIGNAIAKTTKFIESEETLLFGNTTVTLKKSMGDIEWCRPERSGPFQCAVYENDPTYKHVRNRAEAFGLSYSRITQLMQQLSEVNNHP